MTTAQLDTIRRLGAAGARTDLLLANVAVTAGLAGRVYVDVTYSTPQGAYSGYVADVGPDGRYQLV